MNNGSGTPKPNAALAQAVQMNSGNAAIPAAAPQRSLVIDFDYFRTCTANKEWVSTCMANQAFIQQCIDQRERLQPFLSALKCDDGSRENIDARSPPCSQVSAVYEDFPMLASSSPRDLPMTTYEKNPKLDEQHSPVMMDSNEDGRQAVRGKRKYDLISTQQRESSDERTQKPLTQTVVLRPVCKMNVEDFSTKEIRAAIEKTGVKNMSDFTVHRHEKANTIAITTRNSLLAEKFLQIREIPTERQGPQEVQPYKALGSNEVRGVIYLHSPHEEPETLVNELNCNTHKIIAARALGIKKRTILITFEGRTLPRHVRYVFEVYRVAEYRPRPLVCFGCHQIGHKADVCPNNIRRCGSCGQEHGEVEDCQAAPKCVNCNGAHVATSNECPKRKIPPRSDSHKKRQKKPAPRVDEDLQDDIIVLTPSPFLPLSARPDVSWADRVRMNQGAFNPVRPRRPMASTTAADKQQLRLGQQIPAEQPADILPRDPSAWEAKLSAMCQKVEEGLASIQSNTRRIERFESLATEILTRMKSIGEKIDRYPVPTNE